jgi:hypothetical protein
MRTAWSSTCDRPVQTGRVPVVCNSTKAQAEAVEKKFHCVLKAPGNLGNDLAAADDALEVASKGGSVRSPGR